MIKDSDIGVLGAGAAGASTAYYAHEFAASHLLNVNTTVYERKSYVGGRSTTVYALDDPNEPVELGASIFVRVNYNLYDAAQKFGLQMQSMGKDVAAGDDEFGM